MRTATFPYMGDYNVIIKSLLRGLGLKFILPGPITKRTIEIGSKYSPEAVCVPFKYNLGNFIEALEQGATLLLQAGGGCRFHLYGEIQEMILRDLGYEFVFLNVFKGFNHMIKDLKKINPRISNKYAWHLITTNYYKLFLLDKINSVLREKICHEKEPGTTNKIKSNFLKELENTDNLFELHKLKRRTMREIENIKTIKAKHDIKVGIIGEYYVAAEPSGNCFIEDKLNELGIEVKQTVTLSSTLNQAFFYQSRRNRFAKKGYPYIRHPIGAHGTDSVVETLKLIKQGYDGVVHLKPFGCMPEVNAMSALYKISRDKNFPILFFSFDEQTSETGITTRLEAFKDMLIMRARK